VDCGQAIQPVTCLSCGKRWRDIYVLNDIEDIEYDVPVAPAQL
jgi:C4-type Zn-finger protein